MDRLQARRAKQEFPSQTPPSGSLFYLGVLGDEAIRGPWVFGDPCDSRLGYTVLILIPPVFLQRFETFVAIGRTRSELTANGRTRTEFTVHNKTRRKLNE